jgi:hypothetical protein
MLDTSEDDGWTWYILYTSHLNRCIGELRHQLETSVSLALLRSTFKELIGRKTTKILAGPPKTSTRKESLGTLHSDRLGPSDIAWRLH